MYKEDNKTKYMEMSSLACLWETYIKYMCGKSSKYTNQIWVVLLQ